MKLLPASIPVYLLGLDEEFISAYPHLYSLGWDVDAILNDPGPVLIMISADLVDPLSVDDNAVLDLSNIRVWEGLHFVIVVCKDVEQSSRLSGHELFYPLFDLVVITPEDIIAYTPCVYSVWSILIAITIYTAFLEGELSFKIMRHWIENQNAKVFSPAYPKIYRKHLAKCQLCRRVFKEALNNCLNPPADTMQNSVN